MCVPISSQAICQPKDQISSLLSQSLALYPSLLLLPSRSYLDKNISLHLNKGRKVSGTLRGYDQFMNIVLGDALEEVSTNENKPIGMVVCISNIFLS
jgi:small nuclear ribonucleoprotein G